MNFQWVKQLYGPLKSGMSAVIGSHLDSSSSGQAISSCQDLLHNSKPPLTTWQMIILHEHYFSNGDRWWRTIAGVSSYHLSMNFLQGTQVFSLPEVIKDIVEVLDTACDFIFVKSELLAIQVTEVIQLVRQVQDAAKE